MLEVELVDDVVTVLEDVDVVLLLLVLVVVLELLDVVVVLLVLVLVVIDVLVEVVVVVGSPVCRPAATMLLPTKRPKARTPRPMRTVEKGAQTRSVASASRASRTMPPLAKRSIRWLSTSPPGFTTDWLPMRTVPAT